MKKKIQETIKVLSVLGLLASIVAMGVGYAWDNAQVFWLSFFVSFIGCIGVAHSFAEEEDKTNY